ncbi:hypothetical protein KKF84_13515 [Myxococcota bacterium]|nr:hypothetical protein [Myxococcota bacterium]MBU1536338.1 hypothetical protein [Myxococcota bacterium]
MKTLIILSCFVLPIILCACDDSGGEDNNHNNVNNSNNTNNVNNSNNVNNIPDFSTPVGDPAVLYELRGIINTYAALEGGTATDGIGGMSLHVDGDDVLYSQRPVITEFCSSDGTGLIVLSTIGVVSGDSNPHENHVQSGTYSTIYVYLEKAGLLALKEAGQEILRGDAIHVVVHVRTEYFERIDGVRLYRRCNTLVDTGESTSAIQVEMAGVTDFSPGEVVVSRGNVAMTGDTEVITARTGLTEMDEGELCRFIIDGEYVDGETFYSELYADLALDCELPDGFMEGNGDVLTGLFKGTIEVSRGDGTEAGGPGSFDLTLGGAAVEVDDMNRFAAIDQDATEVVHLVLMGDYRAITSSHISLNIVNVDFSREELLASAAEGLTVLDATAVEGALVYYYEYKEIGGGFRYMVCPLAVPSEDTSGWQIAVCNTENVDFDLGEPFQVALNIPMTNDATALAEATGISEACSCVENTAAIDCSDF